VTEICDHLNKKSMLLPVKVTKYQAPQNRPNIWADLCKIFSFVLFSKIIELAQMPKIKREFCIRTAWSVGVLIL